MQTDLTIFDSLAQAGQLSQKLGRPLVTLSYAQSLDGSLAAQRGSPLAISGPQSMAFTHRLRSAHAAILVGRGTVQADDPRLTVRLVDGPQPQPVILDSRLRCSPGMRLLSHPLPPWIATTAPLPAEAAAALQAAGARLLPLPPDADGRVDLAALLLRLHEMGITSLMVEGGPSVIAAFLSQRLVDLAALTIAPVLVGGLPAVESLLPQPFPRLVRTEWAAAGDDLLITAEVVYESAPEIESILGRPSSNMET